MPIRAGIAADAEADKFTRSLLTPPTLWELVSARADRSPDKVFLIDESGSATTFSEFRRRAERVAAALCRQGIDARTRVAWQLPTSPGTAILIAALARLGVVQAPIVPMFGERETLSALASAGADVVLVPPNWRGHGWAGLGELRTADNRPIRVLTVESDLVESDDLAALGPALVDPSENRWIYFTSGTSGVPKGVRHSDSTLLAAARGFTLNGRLGERPDEIGSIPFPIAHVGGVVYLSAMLTAGFGSVLIGGFNPSRAPEIFRRSKVTLSGGSTVFYIALVEQQRAQGGSESLFPDLRLLKGGGAPCPPEVFESARAELGVPVANDYGMTEVPMICVASPNDPDEILALTDGRPVPGVDVRLVDNGQIVSDGEGDVEVRGATVFLGYTDPVLDREAFTHDGWFRTGDRGRFHPGGCLEVSGRTKDMIIRKGENISPLEIESLLSRHPAISEVGVIGLPDSARGERVCAVITVRPGQPSPTVADLAEYLEAEGIMKQKFPEQVEIVDEMPKSGMGKLSKARLRKLFVASSADRRT